MSITNTPLLGLALPVTGTESGTWGTDVNIGVTTLIEAALAGTNSIAITTADVTLSLTVYPVALSNTSSNYATLVCTGAMTAARNLFLPNLSKTYEIINNCTGGFLLSVKGVTGPTTGVTLENGERVILAWSGSDFIKLSNFAGTLNATTVNASGNATITGTMTAGTVTQTSDEEKKEKWIEPDSALLVTSLATIEKWGEFDWKDGGHSIGIGAQSLQRIEGLDAAVHKSMYGALSVNYGGAAMVAAIALAKEVEVLKKIINELRDAK